MIVLHQYEISPFCDKIRRLLHWKGIEYTVREVPVSSAAAVRRINPAGKLPTLEHDGHVVADSTEIAHYLEEKFPDPPVLPADPAQRALCHILEDWADESLYFYEMRLRFMEPANSARATPMLVHADPAPVRALAPLFMPRVMKGILRRQGLGRKTTPQIEADVARHAEAIAGLLGDREWLIGDALTLADLSVFAEFFCLRQTPEGQRAIEPHATVTAWMDRVDRATSAPKPAA